MPVMWILYLKKDNLSRWIRHTCTAHVTGEARAQRCRSDSEARQCCVDHLWLISSVISRRCVYLRAGGRALRAACGEARKANGESVCPSVCLSRLHVIILQSPKPVQLKHSLFKDSIRHSTPWFTLPIKLIIKKRVQTVFDFCLSVLTYCCKIYYLFPNLLLKNGMWICSCKDVLQ